MATLSTEINREDAIKLSRRAARAGLTPDQALKIIVTKGVQFFLGLLVGATN